MQSAKELKTKEEIKNNALSGMVNFAKWWKIMRLFNYVFSLAKCILHVRVRLQIIIFEKELSAFYPGPPTAASSLS